MIITVASTALWTITKYNMNKKKKCFPVSKISYNMLSIKSSADSFTRMCLIVEHKRIQISVVYGLGLAHTGGSRHNCMQARTQIYLHIFVCTFKYLGL